MKNPSALDTPNLAVADTRKPATPPVPEFRVDAAGLSHRGNVRPNNEDQFLICRFGRFFETLQSSLDSDAVPPATGDSGYGLIVADGLGGMAAGEVASQQAVSMLVNLALQTPDWIMRFDDIDFSQEVMRRAKERMSRISEALVEEAKADPGLVGFGTTLTSAWSLGTNLFIAHVGDSRAYLMRGGKLRQITSDDTVAQSLADKGAMTPQEAASSRLRHVLTSCLGGYGAKLDPEVRHLSIEPGDILLLCSDGLTGELDDATLAGVLASGESAQALCSRLVALALKAGGRDNVTVAIAKYSVASPGSDEISERSTAKLA